LVLIVWVGGTLPAPLNLVPLGPRAALAGGSGGGGGPTSWHYHTDHLGSTQVLTDKDGKVLQHVRYEPFGALRGRYKADLSGTAFGKRYEFTGYETESYSGLQYAGARFYDPALGMFLTHDPARQFASPYTYTDGDPVNLVDPDGACVFGIDCALLITVAITATAIAVSVDTYVRTGDVRASFNAGLASAAIGTVGAGLGVLLQPAFSSLTPTLQVSVKLAAVGSGAYGVYQSAENGYVASAVVGSLLAVLAAYELGSEFAKSGSSIQRAGNGETNEWGDLYDLIFAEKTTVEPGTPEYETLSQAAKTIRHDSTRAGVQSRLDEGGFVVFEQTKGTAPAST
jgi:RHS repeat-associated protein